MNRVEGLLEAAAGRALAEYRKATRKRDPDPDAIREARNAVARATGR